MNKSVYIFSAGIILIGAGAWYLLSQNSTEKIIANIPTRIDSTATVKIIAFGDSLTAGYGLTQSQAYPAVLEQRLLDAGYDVQVINSGVSGETTAGNNERAAFISSQNPDIVLLGIGGNDALRVLSVSEVDANIRRTIDALQSGEVPPVILLLQMQAPVNGGLAYKREFDALYEQIAKDKRLILVPFITADLFLDRANKLPDGIHYNALGYQKVVEQHVLPVLEEVLENF